MKQSEILAQVRQVLMEPGSSFYKEWYVRLKLDEEIRRARRHDEPVSVLIISLCEADASFLRHSLLLEELAGIQVNEIRDIDVMGVLGANKVIVCLPHTNDAGAQAMGERICGRLSFSDLTFGTSSYPNGGSGSEDLILAAEREMAIRAGFFRTAASNAVFC